ncbi:hypothetical protein CC80DRAFT_506050 [Byssothecium circinans]|uniref:Uncharacterized protein n=1 Tax=Byssothecium circinans TaxID=147558 RepID=A0A6A5TQ38_9PLEO|nr:hypothetical protein CC80DRAFT_506050 [Byssothecium circinans]
MSDHNILQENDLKGPTTNETREIITHTSMEYIVVIPLIPKSQNPPSSSTKPTAQPAPESKPKPEHPVFDTFEELLKIFLPKVSTAQKEQATIKKGLGDALAFRPLVQETEAESQTRPEDTEEDASTNTNSVFTAEYYTDPAERERKLKEIQNTTSGIYKKGGCSHITIRVAKEYGRHGWYDSAPTLPASPACLFKSPPRFTTRFLTMSTITSKDPNTYPATITFAQSHIDEVLTAQGNPDNEDSLQNSIASS